MPILAAISVSRIRESQEKAPSDFMSLKREAAWLAPADYGQTYDETLPVAIGGLTDWALSGHRRSLCSRCEEQRSALPVGPPPRSTSRHLPARALQLCLDRGASRSMVPEISPQSSIRTLAAYGCPSETTGFSMAHGRDGAVGTARHNEGATSRSSAATRSGNIAISRRRAARSQDYT